MTPRIFFPARSLSSQVHPNAQFELVGEELHYLLRVMRAEPGDVIQLFDGQGQRCTAVLVSAQKHQATLMPGAWTPGPETQSLSLRLIQGLSAADKMDWTIEKAVELGVDAIQPVFTRRSVIRLDPSRAQNKLEHWQRLAIAACRQCGRDRLPEIKSPINLDTWLAVPAAAGQQRLLLNAPASGEAAMALSDWLPADEVAIKGSPLAIDLLIGPEAGFAPDEHTMAIRAGFLAVRLGNLVLRTETAGLAAAAALQYQFGTF